MVDESGEPRDELFRLLEHYEGAFSTHLDLTYKYFSFYLTIMVAILGATLAAIAQSGATPKIVFFAPSAVCMLAVLCYSVVLVFYRRHIEAWMTTENILKLLGRSASKYVKEGQQVPNVPFRVEREQGFPPDKASLFVVWERRQVQDQLKSDRSVEQLMDYFTRRSDVMKTLMATLLVLFVTGAAAAIFILFEGPSTR